MAMTAGGSAAQINVTPMIDVLLVLIIIFMVITPLTPRGLSTAVPQPAISPGAATAPSRDLVIEVTATKGIRLNSEPVEFTNLANRLSSIYALGSNRVVFVKGDRELEYRSVVQIIDIARGAGWTQVALMTR